MRTGAVETLGVCGGTTVNGAELSASDLVGTTLEGAYRITRPIGQGGMSAVYEAVQLRLNKRVAVKVMARELALNEEALARFHREAEITSHLGHPHLVTVMDFGMAPTGQPYLVMEYLEGSDLAHRMHDVGKLTLETAVHITKQVASALAAAHEQGVVHRDLKPANVFLVALPGEPDFVKILDFGISKVRAARTQLTNASTIIGTPDYMSPEQATGMLDEIDHRTDQWALACMIWEMLSGRPPFAGDDVSAVFYQVIHLDPQPLGKRAPDLPPAVEATLRRALSKNMGDRYPSMRDFAKALEAVAFARPAQAMPLPAQVSHDPSGHSRGACDTRQKERRQPRRERRRLNLSKAASPASDVEFEAAKRDSFRRKFNAVHAISAVAVGFVFGAALFLYRTEKPLVPVATFTATRPVGAKPSMAAPPAALNPGTATAAPASGKSKIKRAGLDDLGGKPRSGKQKPEAGEVLVADPSDPFAPPIRLASKHKVARAVKADADFVDPFAP
jgi:serine/threonine protein kinase